MKNQHNAHGISLDGKDLKSPPPRTGWRERLKKIGVQIYPGELRQGMYGVLHDPDKLEQLIASELARQREELQNKPCTCECHDSFMKNIARSGKTLTKLLKGTKALSDSLKKKEGV